jgi:putative membrane protein
VFEQLPALAAIFALLAAAIHLLFFVLESILFRRPAGWRTFGVASQADADVTRDWAFNQGFYNLFLAVGVVVGVVLSRADNPATVGAGIGMVLLATCSMIAAAAVLLISKPKMVRGVVLQGVAPLIAVLALVLT